MFSHINKIKFIYKLTLIKLITFVIFTFINYLIKFNKINKKYLKC